MHTGSPWRFAASTFPDLAEAPVIYTGNGLEIGGEIE
jgi:hypothetical protein